ncbi:MAG: CoA transferase [Gammaproteobacteria bacterium]|nr:CoA transferase [Gammaproteobacteria bacterium]MDE0366185.1 CoA transferase [Gammaproteobacteria bacterium]
MPGPLAGLNVVELATSIQGPAAGLYFANMGARVVKVEPPVGDPSRYHRGVGNALPEDAPAPQFLAMNKAKRSVTLDLYTGLGRAVMAKLLENADLFLSNFRASGLARMGLDLDELPERYPQLVVGHVNGFGPRGPDADKAMLDGAAQARGGLASMSGRPGEMPMPPGVAVADHAGAMQLALGCVTALLNRAATGRGQVVRTSSLGAQLWLQMWELQHAALTGTRLTRAGTHHPNILGPYGVYRTSDGVEVLFVTALTEEAWAEFWIFFDKPEVILKEEWNSATKRLGFSGSEAGVAGIRRHLSEAFASKTFDAFAGFAATQPELICERVRGHDDVLTDPQNLANGYVVGLELPSIGETPTIGTLMDFSATPTVPPGQPPPLGAHTAEVMTELGFAAADVDSVLGHCKREWQEAYAAMFGDD